MFENLVDRLERSFKILKGEGKITEINVAETLKDIRRALLDADVSYKIAKQFCDDVKAKALGQNVLTAVKPEQMMVKIVHDELAALMGSESSDINIKGQPGVVLVAGLNGSGKTTFSGKLALYIKSKRGMKVLLAACDTFRPAAIDQLSDLWTGDAAINESARTYPQEQYGKRYHLASSTYWDAQKSQNPTVMWAEEGGSIGQYSYSKDFNATGPGDDKPSDQYAYRCVRNLGIPLSTSEKIPDDYVQWNPSTRVIDLTRLGYASKRSAYDGGNNLDEHNERDESNKPYVKFQIATEQSYYQSGRQDLSLSWNQFNVRLYPDDWWVDAENPCPKGYRVPNQRELGIMLTIPELKNELSANGNTITNTGFSMNGEGGGLYSKGDRPGFLYVGAEGTFILDTDTYNANGDYSTTDKKGGTRCVRDVTN